MKLLPIVRRIRQKETQSHNILKLLNKKGYKEESMKRRSLFITAVMAMCLVLLRLRHTLCPGHPRFLCTGITAMDCTQLLISSTITGLATAW